MRTHDQHYVGGQWSDSTGDGCFDVTCSSMEEIIGRVPKGAAEDGARAVDAAADAFEAWAGTLPARRAEWLERIADGLTARKTELAELIAREVGMPLKLALPVQVLGPIQSLRHMAGLARALPEPERIENSLVLREPVGVVACITPWNYPLNQVLAKIGPALAAGATVVLKPSEVAPLSAFVLAEVVHQVGVLAQQ